MDEQDKTISPAEPVQIEQPEQPAESPKPKKLTKKQLALKEKQRKQWAERKQAQRDREKEFEQDAISASTEVLNDKAAKALISTEWGITRENLIETVHAWGKKAAEQLKLPATTFYWTNGPVATLASVEAGTAQPLEKCGDENIVVGEITYRKEIFALYHFMEAWRKDAISTFAEYLAERRSCKVDGTINRGNKYFGKDFHAQPHQHWDDMFIRWNPDLLKPDYTQEDAKAWLGAQSENKKRLLIACRNSYKSNFSLAYLVGAVLCNPDIRLLFVSETKPLSKSFLAGFRQFFEISNPNEPRRFVRLFPEYCVSVGDGSALEFQSPMRILGLFQPTAQASSMESGGWAGSRSDYTLFSDSISSNTVGTEDQIQKSVVNTDAILELTEVGGYVHWEGTPWHETDLYAQIMARNERSTEKNLLVIVDPAWTVKDSGKGKDLFELLEEDVELLFPARLTWKFLQSKLRDGDPKGRTFRMQSLCQFLPEQEDEEKLHFDRIWFTRNTVQEAPIAGDVYGSADLGFNKTKYRDPSALTLWRVGEDKLLYCLTQEVGRWTTQEKAVAFVRMARLYPEHFKTWVVEKPSNWADIQRAIDLEASQFGMKLSVHWATVDTTADRKFHALKSMETPLAADKVKFVQGSYLEPLITEVENLDNTDPKRKSKPGGSDDLAESLEIGIRFFLPEPTDESAIERQKMEERQAEKQRLIWQHNRIFGSDPIIRTPDPTDYPQQDARNNPIYAALDPLNKNPQTGEKKMLSFAFMKNIPRR